MDVSSAQTNTPAELADRNVTTWTMWCHLAAFGGLVVPIVGNVIGPLIVWLTGRDKGAPIDCHGKEAVNFQITMTGIGFAIWLVTLVLSMISLMLPTRVAGGMMVVLGLFELVAYLALIVFWLVSVIGAGMAAYNGHKYRYHLALRLIQ